MRWDPRMQDSTCADACGAVYSPCWVDIFGISYSETS